MSTLFIMDAANLFVGDDDPTKGEYLALKSVKLPDLKEITKEHQGGGAGMGLSFGLRIIEKPEFSFKLEGINLRTMTKFMPGVPTNYTVRGNVRDLKNLTNIPALAVVRGKMQSMSMSEFSRDAGIESDYMIGEITSYILTIGGVEKYALDYFSGVAGIRVDGQPIFSQVATNLGLI